MIWMDELPYRATRFWSPAAATPEGRFLAALALPQTVSEMTPELQLHALADKLQAMCKASEDPQTAELLIVEVLERLRLTDEVNWTETALATPLITSVKGNQLLYGYLQEAELTPSTSVAEIVPLTETLMQDLQEWTVERWLDALDQVTNKLAAAA